MPNPSDPTRPGEPPRPPPFEPGRPQPSPTPQPQPMPVPQPQPPPTPGTPPREPPQGKKYSLTRSVALAPGVTRAGQRALPRTLTVHYDTLDGEEYGDGTVWRVPVVGIHGPR